MSGNIIFEISTESIVFIELFICLFVLETRSVSRL